MFRRVPISNFAMNVVVLSCSYFAASCTYIVSGFVFRRLIQNESNLRPVQESQTADTAVEHPATPRLPERCLGDPRVCWGRWCWLAPHAVGMDSRGQLQVCARRYSRLLCTRQAASYTASAVKVGTAVYVHRYVNVNTIVSTLRILAAAV